jgi:hypothetical protein
MLRRRARHPSACVQTTRALLLRWELKRAMAPSSSVGYEGRARSRNHRVPKPSRSGGANPALEEDGLSRLVIHCGMSILKLRCRRARLGCRARCSPRWRSSRPPPSSCSPPRLPWAVARAQDSPQQCR